MPDAPISEQVIVSPPDESLTDGLSQVNTAVTAITQSTAELIAEAWPTSSGSRLRLRNKNEWLLFLTGINLMLLSFIMVRQATMAFRHMEIAVMVFSLAYLAGISIGYVLSDRVSLKVVRLMMPLFLVIHMGAILTLQVFFRVIHDSAETWARAQDLPVGTGEVVASAAVFFVIALGITSLHSYFLPMIIQSGGGSLRRAYSIKVLGSITGLLLVPACMALSWTALVGAYLVTFLGVSLMIGCPRWLVAVKGLVVIAFLIQLTPLDQEMATALYRNRYGSQVENVVHTLQTPYHKIEVLDLVDGERMLLLNGRRQFAPRFHHTYSYFVAEFPARLFDAPRVCVLGCSSMSTVGRIGEHARSIRIVDIDSGIFATSQQFFGNYNRLGALHNWVFTADDAKHFLASTSKTFDLILHDNPPARTRQTALGYTREFFTLVKKRLSPQGIFSIASSAPTESKSRYGQRLLATLTAVFDRYCVIVIGGETYFYGGRDQMPELTEDQVRQAIRHESARSAKIYIGAQVTPLTEGERIVTINNVADLIYE